MLGLADMGSSGNIMSLGGSTNGRYSGNPQVGQNTKTPASPCDKQNVQMNPASRFPGACSGVYAVPAPSAAGQCSCGSTGVWVCDCDPSTRPLSCANGNTPSCSGANWSCGTEYPGGGGEETPPWEGPGSPGYGGSCQTLTEDLCLALCTYEGQNGVLDINCNYQNDLDECDDDWGECTVNGVVMQSDGGPVNEPFMAEGAAVRLCSGYSWLSPVYRATSAQCASYCAGQLADACEWNSSNGDCYAEYGNGCVVEYGYPGWHALVLRRTGTGPGPGGGERLVSFVADNGQFMVAEGNGGGTVNANRNSPGPWETFTLVDLNGGDLWDGDLVALRTEAGWYLQALGGGGGGFEAVGGGIGAWETFRVRSESGSDSRIDHDEELTLEAYSGHYVVAEGGGGGIVNANRTAAGAWETFRLYDHGGLEANVGPVGSWWQQIVEVGRLPIEDLRILAVLLLSVAGSFCGILFFFSARLRRPQAVLS
ncbi:MAG: hypothetical protein AMXMBFR57_11040 [Acidimicrobiia bacterium]